MWSNKYIGIPFKDGGRDSNGLDCWGLVRLIYKDEYNISLPSFNTHYSTVDDTERLEELISQYKEGWIEANSPDEGCVVLFKTMGSITHVGVLINKNQFLHINEGTNVTIESLDSTRWNKRVIGYYKYNEQSSAVLNAVPNPLKTQLYTLPVVPGTTLLEVSNWVYEKYKISKKLAQKIIIIVNGQVIEQNSWASHIVKQNDKIEYRALAGKGNGAKIFRLIAMIAIAYFAPQIAYAIANGGFAASTAAMTAWAAANPITAALLTAGVSMAGSLLVNAIAPIRPPSVNTNDPGSAQAQLMATGNSNRATPYEAIPIVLGKMRITPPLGAINYITYQNERDTYLSSLLIWGYGPLVLQGYNATPAGSGLRIGDLAATNYTIDRLQHHNFNGITNNLSNLNDIYGSDVAQQFINLELVNEAHPFSTPHASPPAIPANVTSLASGEPYTSVQIAIHFPQGLRKIKAQGDDAGKSFTLTDASNGGNYPVKIKFEWDIGAGWTTINSLTSTGEAPGVRVYGDTVKKDAFTITHEITAPDFLPTLSAVQVRLTRLTGSWAEPPAEGTPEYTAMSGASGGTCYIQDWVTTTDGTYSQGEIVDSTALTPSDCEGRWVPNTADINKARDWRFAHQVNFLSLTVRRTQAPVKDPVDTDITKTAIRLKSSQQINGQLEGINAIVQTYGKNFVGGSWIDAAIDNPASLFLHVLLSPANPKRILWSDINNRVVLSQIEYWHQYCATKGFKFNSIIGQQRGLLDILRDICAAGRASPTLVDGKWTVTIDEPKTNIVQHFSPHNSWGFEGSRALAKLPDGLKVNFVDETKDYKDVQIIVYNVGYNEAGTSGKKAARLFEEISLPGVTTATQATDHAKWHMAQALLRRETYTLNTDLEYIICNRGDRVTVAHDVPMWGLGSGRIKNKLDNSTYQLDEAVQIEVSKQYQIKVRNSTDPLQNTVRQLKLSGFSVATSVRTDDIVRVTMSDANHPFSRGDVLNVAVPFFSSTSAVVTNIDTNWFEYELPGANQSSGGGTVSLTDGLYQKVVFTAPIAAYAEPGDLFLFGLLNRISNDLMVVSIEPTSNKTARLTLVDYGVYTDPIDSSKSYNIFTDYLNLSESQTFATNITLPTALTSPKITDVPTITAITSDETVAELLSPGNFRYRIRVSYSNSAVTLLKEVDQVECQYDLDGVNDLERSEFVKYDKNTVFINDVEQGRTYRIRLRYITRSGITGPWTPYSTHIVVGKTANYDPVTTITATLKGKFLELKPKSVPVPENFKEYEIRVYKSTGVGDFWNTAGLLNANGTSVNPGILKIIKTTGPALLDLTEFTQPKIAETPPVKYRIACRIINNTGTYSDTSAVTTFLLQTILPKPFKLNVSESGTLTINIDPPIVNNIFRDDLQGIKVWVDDTSINITNPMPTPTFEGPGLVAVIPGLVVEKTHYFRYAFISQVDPTVYTVSNEFSFIPRSFLEIIDKRPPPDPLGIVAEGLTTSIIITLPTADIPQNLSATPPEEGKTSPFYNYSDYDPITQNALYKNASSSHKATRVFGIIRDSLVQAGNTTFTQVQSHVLGDFSERTVFTIPADPGTIYSLYFKYVNKGGIESTNAFGPVVVETGINVQKFIDMLAGEINEGMLFKGLQERLSRTDRDPKTAPITRISSVEGQYSVKIDAGGQVAGFGLSNTGSKIEYDPITGEATGRLIDGEPSSEFGVVADKFWIAAPAYYGPSPPTTGLYHGRVWVDTSLAGNNEGRVLGVSVYYNTYAPSVHNEISSKTDAKYWYWEIKTKTALLKLINQGIAYVNKGVWAPGTAYVEKDYVEDKENSVFYICIKAYTPVIVSSFATKNPKKLGTFTGSGATFATDNTIFVVGTEVKPTATDPVNPIGTDPGVGNNATLKMGPSYNPLGTFYYITDVSGSEFTLSLTRNGKPIITNITTVAKYYNIETEPNTAYNLDPAKGPIDNRRYLEKSAGWLPYKMLDMFPFIVTTTGNKPGVYIRSAMIADASIDNAKIADASIDNAKIAFIHAGKITAGTIEAERINAGAITIDKIDIGDLRGGAVNTWALASPTLNTDVVERTIDMPPGDYEMILNCTFYRADELLTGTDTEKIENANITAEVVGVSGATVTGVGYWRKQVRKGNFEIKLKNKAGTITTQPTLTVTQPTISFDLDAPVPPPPSGGLDSY